ncbi:Ogr/Delta-like zinc finger [Variovorax sp. YR752]|uniref:ogr/Delta-like zinc finger family protein n=1 Tax=Variovorax sp. YR752 TaxID=1884383 RepID=UPI000BCE5D84|nr:ogr/Delta-like zinc finger family protein [Variovorax sp. YR752]SOD25227.1 Ogr/Delta-like zinc finger [Variovorax sp. YR752]
MRLRCPHCDHLGSIRTTKVMTATVSHHYVVCSNFECGHTWRATTEADMTISPSATPAASVHLPLASHMRREVLAQQIRSGSTAEHTPLMTPPETRDLFAPASVDGPS